MAGVTSAAAVRFRSGQSADALEVELLTPDQLRAARALLDWSRDALSEKSGVPAVTIKWFETGKNSTTETTAELKRAIEAAGVKFIDPDEKGGPGVRLKRVKAMSGGRK